MRSVLAVLLVLIASTATLVAEPSADKIRVEQPWARASIGTVRPAAAYLVVVNDSDRPAQLIHADTPVAAHAEFHRTSKEGAVMTMAPAGSVEIPAGGRVVFEPGGLHIMLTDLKQALEEGATFPLTLQFKDGTTVSTTIPVRGPGAMGPGEGE